MAKASATKETALEPVENNTALATAFVDVAADALAYTDNFQRDDIAIPFLQVLQNGSPQVGSGPKAVEGARTGMLYNTLTKETFDGKQGLVVVPAAYEKTFIEWKPRDSGGGFVKNHGLQSGLALRNTASKNDKGQDVLPNGNQLVETMQYVILILGENGTLTPAMFTLTSTQLKKGRQWNSMIDAIRVERNGKKLRPPMFFMAYKLTTIYESNDKGNWNGVEVKAYKSVEELENGQEVYETAKGLRDSVNAGAVSVEKSAAAHEAAGEAVPF